MIGASRIERIAAESGFRAEVVEKVLYLEALLAKFVRHPGLRDTWVLKGGTALNLFLLDVPRLSVDIDINYVGQAELAAMQTMRPSFEAAIAACCESLGCQVRRMPAEHAGGKLRLRYASAAGGGSNLEVDVNFVLRVPILGVERRIPRFPPDAECGEIPILTVDELAAGKFVALLMRRAARDAYDAMQLLELVPEMLGRPGFRRAFLVLAAGNRIDVRTVSADDVVIENKDIKLNLSPLLRIDERRTASDLSGLAELVNRAASQVASRLIAWTAQEREFLDRLNDHGEVRPDLLSDDQADQALIQAQPSLHWKAANVRTFKASGGVAVRRRPRPPP